MLLDRIDIDVHGPLHRVELGPFSEHLNVVSGPLGSGKTAIVRFVRDSLVERQYPLGMMSSSTGRVVWADGNGRVHCRREKDGTPHGRTRIEFESRGDDSQNFASLRHSWISGVNASTDGSRAARAIQLPESLVDCVITDTALTNVARVVAAAVRNGLDSPASYQDLPIVDDANGEGVDPLSGIDSSTGQSFLSLRSQLAEVEAEITRLDSQSLDYQRLLHRRNELTSRLARREFHSQDSDREHVKREAAQRRLTDLCELARELRARQSELRHWFAELDRGRSGDDIRPRAYGTTVSSENQYRQRAVAMDANLRRQLDDLDAQMIGWRRTLMEIRGLREALLSSKVPFAPEHPLSRDEAAIRRRRLDGFLHSVDRYDRAWDWGQDDGQSHPSFNRVENIRERIHSATRQIDWLLQRYASDDAVHRHWYDTLPASASYRATTTLGDTLRAIREDLGQVHQAASDSLADVQYNSSVRQLDELRECEKWLIASIDQLMRHRQSLLHGHESMVNAKFYQAGEYRHGSDRRDELDHVTAELDACLREAADIRRSLRADGNPRHGNRSHHWTDREALTGELRRIDDQLAAISRLHWLQHRRSQLIERLRATHQPIRSQSPLADAASRWLVRLSAGRLRQLDWSSKQFAQWESRPYQNGEHRSGVRINGQDASQWPAGDQALAVMAVRMAAGDLLASMGKQVPLILETHRDVFSAKRDTANGSYQDASYAYHQMGSIGRSNHPIATALHDYTRAGRQIVLLTSSDELAAQVSRVGGRSFRIHAQQVVHPHRPLWQPQYESERYVGPHPHTYGVVSTPEAHDVQPHWVRAVVDINRDFDLAWREANGLDDTPERTTDREPARTDRAAAGVDYRDGYYFADTYTTVKSQTPYQFDDHGNWVSGPSKSTAVGGQPISGTQQTRGGQKPVAPAAHSEGLHATVPPSPFFLTVDSPIDQAPSVDAVAAARLRGLRVTHINHLMQQDSNRLADALGLASVNAATIRRWQAECRLVCRVPQLRGFDARVLVGCGVTDPGQLAAIHPVDLLQEVESFLATEQGQQILLSGSSRELSRITSWIAAANSSPSTRASASARNQASAYRGQLNNGDSADAFDRDRYQDEAGDVDRVGLAAALQRRRRDVRSQNRTSGGIGAQKDGGRQSRNGIAGQRTNSNRSNGRAAGYGRASGYGRAGYGDGNSNGRSGTADGSGRGRGEGSGNGLPRRRRRSGLSNRNGANAGDGYGNGNGEAGGEGQSRSRRRGRSRRSGVSGRTNSNLLKYGREPREASEATEVSERQERAPRPERSEQSERTERDASRELRFYLQRDSPVVDAPSIGARMAERLQAVGIESVNDLLVADPETVAAELDHRRVDSETVLQWQQQAEFVCRVPMLRGHDAQLLVMADVTTPEDLALCDPAELLGQIDPISESKEGQRIIRGGKAPDLEEITEWISYAQHTRELVAA